MRLRPQVVRVHQRAVVGERDERVVDGGDVRLGRLPGGLRRRSWSSARGPMATTPSPRPGQRRLVEDLGHKPQVLRLDDRGAVAHGDAGALLAAMLQGLQPVAGQARHVLARGVHAEDAALLLQPVRTAPREARTCSRGDQSSDALVARRRRPRRPSTASHRRAALVRPSAPDTAARHEVRATSANVM